MFFVPEVLMKYDYYIKWRISYECNYHCEYCLQNRNKCKERRNEQSYDIIGTANKIADMICPKTLIELVGGEISIVKEVPEIVSLFKSKGADVKCLTNLSNDWTFYKDFTELRASFHPSQCDMEEFKNKLLNLKSNGVIVGAEVVLSPVSSEENNQKKMDFAKWCEDNGIEITIDTDRFDEVVKSLRPNPIKRDYYYYVDGVKTKKKELLDEKGMFESHDCNCYIGVNSTMIIFDKISVCNGNEHTEFKWYDKPQKCKYDHCGNMTCMAFRIEK